MKTCPFCTNSQLPSAAICLECGFEFLTVSQTSPQTPPPVPSVSVRFFAQAKPATRLLTSMLVAGLFVLAFMLISETIFGIYSDVALIFVSSAAIAVAVMIAVGAEWQKVKLLLVNHSFSWWLPAIGGAVLLAWCAEVYIEFLQKILPSIEFEGSVDSHHIVVWISLVILPAVFEEIGFRGIFLNSSRIALTPKVAELLTAFVFASVHFNIPFFPMLMLIGLALGRLRLLSNSLWPSIVMHGVYNGIVLF